MNVLIEIWKDIPEWKGVYQASSFGRIKSLQRVVVCRNGINMSVSEKIMQPCLNTHGYYIVLFKNKGRKKTSTVHRLIAETFIQNTENKRTVNHKNGIKIDNRLENLEWATMKENNIHAYEIGLKKIPNGKDCHWLYGKTGKNSLVSKSIIQMDLNGKIIKKYDSLIDAVRDIGLRDSSGITKCAQGKLKSSGGYKWRFSKNKQKNENK